MYGITINGTASSGIIHIPIRLSTFG